MTAEETNTLSSILNAGKKEFLAKGFRSASLRSIVKEAGVTTGAFYGYYKSKEDLFRALVGEPAQTFLSVYHHAQDSFAELPRQNNRSIWEKYPANVWIGWSHTFTSILMLLNC